MGAGHGTWYRDILMTIENLAKKNVELAQNFLTKTEFHIIEINIELQKIQQQNLVNFKVNWHENFDNFLLLKNKDLIKFNFIANCSLHPNYIKNKYI